MSNRSSQVRLLFSSQTVLNRRLVFENRQPTVLNGQGNVKNSAVLEVLVSVYDCPTTAADGEVID